MMQMYTKSNFGKTDSKNGFGNSYHKQIMEALLKEAEVDTKIIGADEENE